jgi:hypothetical protein
VTLTAIRQECRCGHDLATHHRDLHSRGEVVRLRSGDLAISRDQAVGIQTGDCLAMGCGCKGFEKVNRCSELLEEVRSLRKLKELETFWLALSVAREKHPEGTTPEDFELEIQEARHAGFHETPTRFLAEMMDCAVTALRVVMGGDRREVR